MADRFLTIKEVAGLIGVTPLTLRNWDKRGVLRAHRNPANNYRLYRYSEVANFITEIEHGTKKQPSVQRLHVRLEEDPSDTDEAPLQTATLVDAPLEDVMEAIEESSPSTIETV